MNYRDELFRNINNIEIIFDNVNQYKYFNGFDKLIKEFIRHKEQEAHLFFIGNGGSSAIASHMTADFMKNGGMRTCSLYDSAMMTCMGNDYGYEEVFSKPLGYLLRQGDLLVAISSTGNSQNIINAINVAKKKEATVITFTGFKPDNKVKQLGNINVYVPCEKYGMVESIHNMILQQVVDEIVEKESAILYE